MKYCIYRTHGIACVPYIWTLSRSEITVPCRQEDMMSSILALLFLSPWCLTSASIQDSETTKSSDQFAIIRGSFCNCSWKIQLESMNITEVVPLWVGTRIKVYVPFILLHCNITIQCTIHQDSKVPFFIAEYTYESTLLFKGNSALSCQQGRWREVMNHLPSFLWMHALVSAELHQ